MNPEPIKITPAMAEVLREMAEKKAQKEKEFRFLSAVATTGCQANVARPL